MTGMIWEPHVVQGLADHVVSGTVALDVGAYIGTHAMLMARLVGPRGRVYAIEPQRKVYRELRHNIPLNSLKNIVPLRYAIGAVPGENQVLAGAANLIRANKPVILLEILGGKSYPGVPNWWHHNPPASPQDLQRIHATWEMIEAFGYEVRPVSSHDYIALPVEQPDASSRRVSMNGR